MVFLHPLNKVLVLVSIIALQLLRESYFELPLATVIDLKLLQLENAPSAILVTLWGMLIEERAQPVKAFSPMLVTLLGMMIEVRLLQSWKALYPICVTLLGIVIDVNPLQPLKAREPILVTLLGIVMAVN